MEINVTMLDGTSFSLVMNPQDTLGSLKAKIQAKVAIPPNRQRLVLLVGDRKKTLGADSLTLVSCGVRSGSQISLLRTEPSTIQVFLKNETGGVNKYDVKPDETVKELKKMVQSREGVQASQQRLLHQSREMMDGTKISDYSVQDQSTIELMLHLRGG